MQEILLRFFFATLEQEGQAAPGVGHDVCGVDPDVFATVLQYRLGITTQVLDQDADDLRCGQPRIEPEGHSIVVG